MTVGQVIEIAQEDVEKEASQAPGFCGAYLAGAINRMPKEASFPLYRDVDVYIPVAAWLNPATFRPPLVAFVNH